ncbi:MAG: tetratricopeptide repeat protein [Bacteroidota bacterium]
MKKERSTVKHKQEYNTSIQNPVSKPTAAILSDFSFTDFKIQAMILIILGFILYTNSFYNEYALDDGIVIQKNEYVQRGIRGIPKILSTDAYDSFYRSMNAKQQLSGGRYRPLSVITFAIEQQLFGSKEKAKTAEETAFIRHVINVLFYILSVVVLLYFLRDFIFKDNPLAAFIASFIFLIHPLHTEVVANIKSRDEILSFLFIILTFIKLLSYHHTKEKKQLFYAVVCYFLAFLSKEYAITLLILIPMLLYITKNYTLKESIIATIPFILVAAVYLFIRFSIVGKGGDIENPDVLNNPFKFATSSEKWATKIEILNHYLRLLFYPYPLSSDYSYNTIPYTNFGNVWVWVSILLHLSAITATIVLFFKRNILAFALAFYLLHLLLISNILMDLGATMGERLIYHSSLGFAISIAFFAAWSLGKLKQQLTQKIIGIGLGILVTCGCALVVIQRNTEWKNDTTLFIADAKTVPNSALVNGNAGKAYIDMSEKPENKSQEKELTIKSIYHLSKSVLIHKEYVNGYLNLGVAYFKLKQYDKARENWDIAKRIYPNNPFLKTNLKLMGTVYYNEAMLKGKKQPFEALKLLEKAVEVDPKNADYWYNLGGVCYTVGDFEKARVAWTKTLLLNPDKEDAKRGMAAIPRSK